MDSENCLLPLDALYGMCVEFSEELSSFLSQNNQAYKVWGLWALFDSSISDKLPIKVEMSSDEMNKLFDMKDYTLSDIGYEVHVVIEWNGDFWDVNGKQTQGQIISNFDIDNRNMHFFLLDYETG